MAEYKAHLKENDLKKPNFNSEQMNIELSISRDYEKKSKWILGENKPKTNPILRHFGHAQCRLCSVLRTPYGGQVFVSLASFIFYNCRTEQERPILNLSLMNLTMRYQKRDTRIWPIQLIKSV
jgi:hypothetical protein